MSGFTGYRGRKQNFSGSCFQGQQYTNFDSPYNSESNAYVQDYSATSTGDNSFNQNVQGGLETGTSYWQDSDFGADAYQDNGNTYSYDEESNVEGNQHTGVYQQTSYGFDSDSHKDQSHYNPRPASNNHNFPRGNSTFEGRGRSSNLPFRRSANLSKGQFSSQNRGQPLNHFARRGFGNSNDRGRGRGPRRGRFGPFTENKIVSEKGQFDALEGNKMGRFDFRNKDSGTKPNVVENDCKGQFGCTIESLKPETFCDPSTGNSSDEQPSVNKSNSEQPSNDQANSEQPSNDQANSEQSSNDQANSEQMMQKEVVDEKIDETTEQENENEEESDSSDEDTDFCKYCKLNFSTPEAYQTHTRGLQHTTLVMEAKANEGHKHYMKEKVDASVLEVHIPKPKPEKTESEEYEDNWMNLDDDDDPENRDLNPSDVGKNPLPDDFNCALCNVKCTGAGSFKMHIEGKNHRNNIEAAKQGAKVKQKKQAQCSIMIETKNRPSKFSEIVKGNKAPMLGLEFVTEFQKSDIKAAARYVCNLCAAKCDGSTIVPHVIGLKHRLKYLQVKRPSVYDHVTKFSTKKRKSEMNASIEELTRDIEKTVGRGDVKVKVELEDFEDENDFKESMIRHSKELAETYKKLEEMNSALLSNERKMTSKGISNEPPVKKMRVAPEHVPEQRPANDAPPRSKPLRDRDPHYDNTRRKPHADHRRPTHDVPRHNPYDAPMRSPYDDRRRHGYDDWRDPYQRRYPDDFRVSYRDRFDPCRLDDPMYERRMFDERRRLDGLMAARYRLDDPYAERRRVDDIVERRRYLDQLERARLDDIMERRKRLQEADVDYMRLKRFMERDAPATTSSPSISVEEKKRLDDVLARREALKTAESQATKQEPNQGSAYQGANQGSTYQVANQQDIYQGANQQDIYQGANQQDIYQGANQGSTNWVANQQDTYQGAKQEDLDMQDLQSKLASHRSSDPEIAARQDIAAKALREEAAKNPHVNIAEVMTSLSTSMIATEDDAAMALQISNALTQALLKYRLMNAPKELTSLANSVEPVLEQKVVEPSIPGLGASSSASSVPSFLRTSQQDSYSTNYSTSGSDVYSYTSQESLNSMSQPSLGTTNSFLQTAQSSTASSVTPVASSSYLYSSQPSSQSQYSYLDSTLNSQSQYSYLDSTLNSQSQQTSIAPAAVSSPSLSTGTTFSGSTFPGTTFSGTTLYSGYSQNQQSVTASAPTTAPSQTVSIDNNKIKALINSSNTDQPQKFLLESIRKQTELLRQKIQASTGIAVSGDGVGSGNVQSQSQHVPGSTSSSISYSSPSLNQSPSVSSHMTSPPIETPVSSYSSHYYQYNYHTSVPNPAPPQVPPEQPPLPSEPAPPLPLPTNDLPPIRRKRHR